MQTCKRTFMLTQERMRMVPQTPATCPPHLGLYGGSPADHIMTGNAISERGPPVAKAVQCGMSVTSPMLRQNAQTLLNK